MTSASARRTPPGVSPERARLFFRPLAVAAFAAVILAAGCNEPETDPIITISPANKTASVGQTIQYTVTVQEGSDKTIDERPPAWFSTHTDIATITTPAGLATAKAVGTTNIQVSFGNAAGAFYTKATTLTVVASSADAAKVRNGMVLVLGASAPVARGGP